MKLLTLLFILIFSLSAFGQTEYTPELLNSCKNNDSPIVQGLRLGTKFSDIQRDTKLPLNSRTSIAEKKDTYLILNPNKNVSSLFLTFYKSQLLMMMATYSNAIKWNSLEEFRQKIGASLNIYGNWKRENAGGKQTAFILCDQFSVLLTYGKDGYSLFVKSSVLYNQQQKDEKDQAIRKAIINLKKKETFIP